MAVAAARKPRSARPNPKPPSDIAPTVVETAPIAGIGDNNPPEDIAPPVALTPYETMKIHIDDLFEEAVQWLDGDPVTTQAQADAIDKLKAMALEAEKTGEAERKAEAKPFDDGKKAVQDKWNPLVHKDTGKCRKIIKTCNTALAPFLKAEQDRINAAAAAKQAEADRLAEEARRAHRMANPDNLAEQDAAEQRIREAQFAQKDANRASKERAQAHGGGRATSLRDVYTPVLVDPALALRFYKETQPEALKAWLVEQAEFDVGRGLRAPDAIPGFRIDHDQVAR